MIDIKTYARKLGIPVSAIYSKSRKTEVVTARQVYWRLMLNNGFSYSEIGRFFNKNHATIIHGISKINDFISVNDSYLKRYLDAIE